MEDLRGRFLCSTCVGWTDREEEQTSRESVRARRVARRDVEFARRGTSTIKSNVEGQRDTDEWQLRFAAKEYLDATRYGFLPDGKCSWLLI